MTKIRMPPFPVVEQPCSSPDPVVVVESSRPIFRIANSARAPSRSKKKGLPEPFKRTQDRFDGSPSFQHVVSPRGGAGNSSGGGGGKDSSPQSRHNWAVTGVRRGNIAQRRISEIVQNLIDAQHQSSDDVYAFVVRHFLALRDEIASRPTDQFDARLYELLIAFNLLKRDGYIKPVCMDELRRLLADVCDDGVHKRAGPELARADRLNLLLPLIVYSCGKAATTEQINRRLSTFQAVMCLHRPKSEPLVGIAPTEN